MKFQMYHSCITVLDLQKSMDFYEKALGLKPVRTIDAEDGSSKIVFLASEGSNCQLELTWFRIEKNHMIWETTKFMLDSESITTKKHWLITKKWDAFASKIRNLESISLRIRTDIGWKLFRQDKKKDIRRDEILNRGICLFD